MYLGTEFHRYWAECGDALIHPRDQSYFENNKTKQSKEACDFVTSDYGPWSFDGPMETAKIVVCYANPAYSVEGGFKDEVQHALTRHGIPREVS
ncbi:hypothetical protein [Limnohabitans sp.]|uniref:hypothetical protein n=1 Tax=Limnohabitans sp. TaxID=1907725 RepID=UPI00286F17DB|nr:hypothetical protein [Limnohabitans sp.]